MSYRDTNERNSARIQGQAGVYRVASELMLRGFNPKFPAVDCGADLEIEGGIRIQVKAAHLRTQGYAAYPQGAYWFKLARGPVAHGNHGVRPRSPRIFSRDCEFVVFWGIEQHRFWIVPAPILDGRHLVVLGPDTWWVDVDVNQIKEMSNSGMTQTDIAKSLGTTRATVDRRLRGMYAQPSEARALTHKVRDCEGKWDLIESAVDIMTEARQTTLTETTAEKEIMNEQNI